MTIENLFFLVILSLPLYLVRLDIFGVPTNVSELLAVLATTLLFIRERKSLSIKLRSVPKPVSSGVLLVLVGALSSLLFGNAYAVGFGILKGWFLIPILFSFALYVALASQAAIEKIFLSLYLSAAIVGAISLIYKLAGAVTFDNRLAAFYLSPNYLAMYLANGIFFGGYFWLSAFSQKQSWRNLGLHLVPLSAILFPLYYTYSYGAWAAVFFSLLLTLLLVAPRKKYMLGGTSILLAVFLLFSQISTQKFSALAQLSPRSSFASRDIIWKASLLMLRQHPVFGIGPGNFQAAYLSLQPHFPPYLEWAVPQPHNLFLAFWLQTGLLGLAGFLLLVVRVLHALLILLKNKKNAALAAPLLGFFIYTTLHGFIDTPYWKNDLAFLFWISVFLVMSLRDLPTFKK